MPQRRPYQRGCRSKAQAIVACQALRNGGVLGYGAQTTRPAKGNRRRIAECIATQAVGMLVYPVRPDTGEAVSGV